MSRKDPEARKAYKKKWYKANTEKIIAQQREYRKANAERISAQNREWYKANRERINARVREYQKSNREKVLARLREWRKANRERINAQKRKYHKANPEKTHASAAYRRARKKECSVPLTETEKTKLRSMSRNMQRLNKKKGGVEYHIDHIVPMDYGGVHHPCNLQIMEGSENCSKNNKITPEALDLVPVCYKLYLERVGAEKAEWFRDEIAEAIGLQEANRLIGMERAAPSTKPTLEDLME
jgi:hypothetical protein